MDVTIEARIGVLSNRNGVAKVEEGDIVSIAINMFRHGCSELH